MSPLKLPPPGNTASTTTNPSDLELIEIVPHGDILLDVTFETSKPVILAAKKAYAAYTSRPAPRSAPSRSSASRSTTKPSSSSSQPTKTPSAARPPRPPPKPRVRVGFRVQLSVLKEHSPYFARLLSDTRFAEAKAVEAGLEKLKLDGESPGEVGWTRLPRVSIKEDDEATQSAEVREVFEDLLYLLHHGKLPVRETPTPTPTLEGEGKGEGKGELEEEEAGKAASASAPPAESKTVSARTVKAVTKTGTPTKRPGQPPGKTPAKTQANGLKKPLDKTSPKTHPYRPKTPTDQAIPQPPQPSTPSTPSPGPPPLTIPYLTTLSLIADRFSLLPSLCRLQLSSLSQIKWPSTPTRITKEQDGHALTLAGEELLRQKILVAWLLDFPLKFQASCRELVLFGSRRWTLSAAAGEEEDWEGDGEEDDSGGSGSGSGSGGGGRGGGGGGGAGGIRWKARWWTLPDNLEDELSYRRTCLLSVLASIPRHFLRLYIVRPPQTRPITTSSAGIGASFTSNAAFALQAAAQGRQCKLGYESSMSCDSYQLGEMVRFLCTKGLLSLVDFSPMSFDRAIEQYDGGENPLAKVDNNNPGGGVVLFGPPRPSASKADSGALGGISTMEINHFVALLRQCPSYQIDGNHTNCGLRTRMSPVLEYVQAMMASDVILIKRADWDKRREEVSWVSLAEKRGEENEGKKRVFKFTRNLATDPRMRYSTTMGTIKIAMDLFLADEWDWTAEEY